MADDQDRQFQNQSQKINTGLSILTGTSNKQQQIYLQQTST